MNDHGEEPHLESEEEAEAAGLRRRLDDLERRRQRLVDDRVDSTWESARVGVIGLPGDTTEGLERDPETAGEVADLDREIGEIEARIEELEAPAGE